MIKAFNLACVPRTVNHRADVSLRSFTIINQVIYKQANKNKWLQYISCCPCCMPVCSMMRVCVLGVANATVNAVVCMCVGACVYCAWSHKQWHISVVKFRMMQEKHIRKCGCLWSSGLLEQQWWWKGLMRRNKPGAGSLVLSFDKIETQGTWQRV